MNSTPGMEKRTRSGHSRAEQQMAGPGLPLPKAKMGLSSTALRSRPQSTSRRQRVSPVDPRVHPVPSTIASTAARSDPNPFGAPSGRRARCRSIRCGCAPCCRCSSWPRLRHSRPGRFQIGIPPGRADQIPEQHFTTVPAWEQKYRSSYLPGLGKRKSG